MGAEPKDAQRETRPTPLDAGEPDLAGARAALERTRDEVAQSMVALQRELVKTTNWRAWVTRKPLLSLSLAFAFGFALGHRRPSPR